MFLLFHSQLYAHDPEDLRSLWQHGGLGCVEFGSGYVRFRRVWPKAELHDPPMTGSRKQGASAASAKDVGACNPEAASL